MSEAKERLDTRTSGDRLQLALHHQRYEFVLANLRRLESVLEVGTGEGNLSVQLARRCGSFVGLEFDANASRVTSQRLGGTYRVLQADARKLPFRPRSFSSMVCLEVLEHLGDFRSGIRNIHRCLREDGSAIISVPYRYHGGPNPNNAYHLYEPGERELISSLEQCFAVVRVHYQYFQETAVMKAARRLHLRRMLGFERFYRALTEGEPEAISRLNIESKPRGMKMHLVIIAESPRAVTSD